MTNFVTKCSFKQDKGICVYIPASSSVVLIGILTILLFPWLNIHYIADIQAGQFVVLSGNIIVVNSSNGFFEKQGIVT